MVVFALIVGLVLVAIAVAIDRPRAVAVPERAARGDRPDRLVRLHGHASRAADEPATRSARSADLADVARQRRRRAGSGRCAKTTIRRRLVAAGWYTTTPRAFIGYQLMGAIAFCASSGSGSAALGGTNSVVYVLGILLAAAVRLVRCRRSSSSGRSRTRHHQIDRELPELIDLLVVTVEAGIGFVGSLRLAAQQLDGPLAQELRLTLQEQSMGLSSTEALEGMPSRADTPGHPAFVRAIIQGETLGVSIGQILRNLADEMRKRRKALAEEQAQKAPVKMLFPLIFLIFPAMFVVLLLPAIIASRTRSEARRCSRAAR